MNPRLVLALSLLVVFALGAVIWAKGTNTAGPATITPDATFAGATIPPGVNAPDFALRDENGAPISMADLRGNPVIVTFLYASCEETCPPQAQQIKGALDELGSDIPAIAIAVDPPRDTVESARAFVLEQRMSGRMDFLVGAQKELEPVWKGFAIQAQIAGAEHQARIMVVDSKGFQRVSFPIDQATPERIAHDVREVERG